MNIPKENKKYDAITMGEILLRLSSPHSERLSRSDVFEKNAGGAEMNVAAGIALLGLDTAIISQVPDNDIGHFIRNEIRFYGVSDECLIMDESDDARIGLYFYEHGRYPRNPKVIYDRENSSFLNLDPDKIPDSVFDNTRLFHFSGIDLALSKESREATIKTMKRFKEAGAKISFDVNFRANLWSGKEAKEVIEPLLDDVDIFFVSEDTARLTFGSQGTLEQIQKDFADRYGIDIVASTKRKVNSPLSHDFTSTIYSREEDKYYKEAPYTDIEVIDRIGSGDAYVAGMLYGLLESGDPQRALEVGNAFSALKNTSPGDMPTSDLDEVETVIRTHKITDGYIPEMTR